MSRGRHYYQLDLKSSQGTLTDHNTTHNVNDPLLSPNHIMGKQEKMFRRESQIYFLKILFKKLEIYL